VATGSLTQSELTIKVYLPSTGSRKLSADLTLRLTLKLTWSIIHGREKQQGKHTDFYSLDVYGENCKEWWDFLRD